MTLRLIATLPRDRREPGILEVLDGDGRRLHRCPCRGKADGAWAVKKGNPGRDPVKTGGDTPLGGWGPTRTDERTDGEGTTPMGRWVWWLGPPVGGVPQSGQAVEAARNGRTGLAIHAGRGDGDLIATHGCLRIKDGDAEILAKLIGDDAVTVTIREGV